MISNVPLIVTEEDILEKGCDSGGWYHLVKTKINWLYQPGRRDRKCLACGKSFGPFEMHHGIVSRAKAMGWKFPHLEELGYPSKSVRLMLITNELNCIPLHAQCNKQNVPSPQEIWDYQRRFYSEEIMRWWYEEVLPWKNKPYQFFYS